MQRIVFRSDAEQIEPDGDSDSAAAVTATQHVTLVFPATRAEYERALAGIEPIVRRSDETLPGRVPAAPTEGAAYVATTDAQRRAWSLPDIADAGSEGERPAVAVMAPRDAIRTLLGGAARGQDSRRESELRQAGAEAEDGGAQRPATDIVNLKDGRGRIPSGSRQAFDELSRRTQLDAARGRLGAAIDVLEHQTLPALEQSHRTLATLSQRPITRQRQSEACETDPLLDPDERLAAVCWAVRRRFDRAERALAPLTSSALVEVQPKPADVRRSLRACDKDDIDTKRLDEVIEQLSAALPAWGHAVSSLIDQLCRLAAIRRGLPEGEWDEASLRTLQSLVRDIDAVRGSLEDTEALKDDLGAARSHLDAVEKHWKSAGSLESETRELLGRIEAADLPVRVLDEALHEVRRSLTATYETAATMLDRVRWLTRLPWVRRAPERVELARAMAGLEASHAGCRRIKDRIRRFLAVRTLHGTAWTVEACGAADGLAGDSRGPAALVVRQPRPTVPSPILCFAGPPGCGKTSLAKVIGEALGRPCVTVPLGGVWDEAHVRGLPLSFRAPEPGLIVKGLAEAGVRNPVVILDEIDKVGRRTSNVGNPSAALLDLLDPAQNTAFTDRYAGVPIDLGDVLWIGTANDLEAMPAPLRDRMDVIEVPGYTDEEKVAIVRRHLERIIEGSGLAVERLWTGGPGMRSRERTAGHDGSTARSTLLVEAADSAAPAPSLPVEFTDAAIRAMIRGHTCESGVRQLLRLAGAVCEEVACRRVTTGDASPVLIVAHEKERPDVPATRRLTVDQVLGPAQHETVPDAVRDVVAREQERVMALPRADPEAARVFDWIEVATDLPWTRRTVRVGWPAGKPALDRHVGCEQQKQRLLDHLAAGDADTGMAAADALPCLTGPAGTGKTALARSLAAALGRGFVEVSLAGLRDAAAIRGIARPRPDAAPGCLVRGLRQLGVPAELKSANPVVVLDRLDQLAEGPAADALLDALDPDRNHVFRDHYLGLPIDLAAVTWLATAADAERVPGTLRDRLDVISLPGYCQAEKLRIAVEHVIPRQLAQHGLTPERLSFTPAAIRRLIRGYTREAGVKQLDRLVGAFARRVARLGREHGRWPGEVGPEALGAGIAEPPFREGEFAERTRRPGVAVGLGVSPEGGRLGVVEARCLPGRGAVRVTGTLGTTMRESVSVALTWVREHAHRLGALSLAIDWTDIHVHLPAGGRRQDGPSAGVTIVTAVVSVLTGMAVRPGVAMTGEITLSGDVLPVGSVEEKLLVAGHGRMAAVVVPIANRPDVMSAGEELRREVAVYYAATIDDVLNVALPGVLRE